MAGIKLAIFDLDGLLIDSERLAAAAAEKAAGRLNIPLSRECILSTVGITEEASRELYCRSYPEHAHKMEELFRLSGQIYTEAVERGEVKPKDGAKELLSFLKGKKLPCVLASSSSRSYAERCLKLTGLREYFSALFTGDDISRSKPDPEIFLLAAGSFGTPTENALVLEDSVNGLLAACAGGFRCILIPDMVEIPPDIERKAWMKLESLRDVISSGIF